MSEDTGGGGPDGEPVGSPAETCQHKLSSSQIVGYDSLILCDAAFNAIVKRGSRLQAGGGRARKGLSSILLDCPPLQEMSASDQTRCLKIYSRQTAMSQLGHLFGEFEAHWQLVLCSESHVRPLSPKIPRLCQDESGKNCPELSPDSDEGDAAQYNYGIHPSYSFVKYLILRTLYSREGSGGR